MSNCPYTQRCGSRCTNSSPLIPFGFCSIYQILKSETERKDERESTKELTSLIKQRDMIYE